MHIAIVGCGYVADFYAITVRAYPDLRLVGAYDRNGSRSRAFACNYGIEVYPSLETVLEAPEIGIVVNLTNPGEHYAVTKQCLLAGKHVYSEKPLATTTAGAVELCQLARREGVLLACAPASLLSRTAQTIWWLLRQRYGGRTWLAYAEIDDGPSHLMDFHRWKSPSGAPWPYCDEWLTGCTLEHAAYQLSWLTAFFGPVREVTSFAACLVPDKAQGDCPDVLGDDFSCACLQFSSGVVARLTCSVLAPPNRSLTLVGSDAVISTGTCWRFEEPVFIQRLAREADMYGDRTLEPRQQVPLKETTARRAEYEDVHDLDFACGIADLADAVKHGRRPRLSGEHAAHLVEVMLAIVQPERSRQVITTTFPAIEPMPWAEGESKDE